MPGRSAEGLEGIIRLFPVALKVRDPVAGEMFRNAPFIIPGPAKHLVDDPACSHTVFFFSRHVRHSEKCLHRVHVGVQAAVAVQDRKFRIPGINAQAFVLSPEAQVIEFKRLIQEFLRSGSSRKDARAGCQNYKGVRVALFCRKNLTILSQTCIPAAVILIVQFSPESLQCRVGQRFAAFMPQERSQTVYMRHTACNPSLPVSLRPGRTVVSKIIGAASRRRKTMAEAEEIFTDLFQKRTVFFGVNLISRILILHHSLLPSEPFPILSFR